VCKYLNAIVEAKLFSHIIIDVHLRGPQTAAAQLQALSSGRGSRHARTLEIRSLEHKNRDKTSFISRIVHRSHKKRLAAAMTQVRKYLHGAIVSLKNVMAVSLVIPDSTCTYYLWPHSWTISLDDTQWAIDMVMESIAALPSFTDFQLDYRGHSSFTLPFHLLSGLRRIAVEGFYHGECHKNVVLPLAQAISRSPELLHLDVWCEFDGETPLLNDLFGNEVSKTCLHLERLSTSWEMRLDEITLPHFKSLTSFSLWSDANCQDIWRVFLAKGIRLTELTAQTMSNELLEFIASYSGLHSLSLLIFNEGLKNATAETFFRHALPLHHHTLRSLTLWIESQCHSSWFFSEVNASAILGCKKLNELCIGLQRNCLKDSQRNPVVR
jgi:hypothetical protein